MNTDMSRRQFVGLAGSLATVLGLGLVGCGGGAGKGSAAGSAAAKDVKGAAEQWVKTAVANGVFESDADNCMLMHAGGLTTNGSFGSGFFTTGIVVPVSLVFFFSGVFPANSFAAALASPSSEVRFFRAASSNSKIAG